MPLATINATGEDISTERQIGGAVLYTHATTATARAVASVRATGLTALASYLCRFRRGTVYGASFPIPADASGNQQFDSDPITLINGDTLSLYVTGGAGDTDTDWSGVVADDAVTIISDSEFGNEAIRDAIGQLSISGTGARVITVVVADEDDEEQVIPGARVRFSTPTVTRLATTNSSGVAVFGLDDAEDWQLSVTAVGYDYTPTPHNIGANQTISVPMTMTAITPADNPAFCIGTITTFDSAGNLAPNTEIKSRLVATKTDGEPEPGRSFPTNWLDNISNSSAIAAIQMIRGGRYEVQRGSGESVTVDVPEDQDVFNIDEVLGGALDGITV